VRRLDDPRKLDANPVVFEATLADMSRPNMPVAIAAHPNGWTTATFSRLEPGRTYYLSDVTDTDGGVVDAGFKFTLADLTEGHVYGLAPDVPQRTPVADWLRMPLTRCAE